MLNMHTLHVFYILRIQLWKLVRYSEYYYCIFIITYYVLNILVCILPDGPNKYGRNYEKYLYV